MRSTEEPRAPERCVYAEGVELGKLPDEQRFIALPGKGLELIVGRTAQHSVFWDVLVPDRRQRGVPISPCVQSDVLFACPTIQGVPCSLQWTGSQFHFHF